MAQPQFVPTDLTDRARTYASPPRRPDSWRAERPADLDGRQPTGGRLGSQGPDQGFMLKLARQYHGKVALSAGEDEHDALAVAMAVGMKRASLFGRAPVIHDLTVGLAVYGFLAEAPDDLVGWRRPRIEGVHHVHHYNELRDLVDRVPEETLRLTPQQVTERHATEWASLLNVS